MNNENYSLPNIGQPDTATEVQLWLLAAAVRVWSVNNGYSDTYLEILPIFQQGSFTPTQLVTALRCAGEDGRQLTVPQFFKNVVEADIEDETAESRKIAIDIAHFLTNMALINGDFTIQEATEVREIYELLNDYCDSCAIPKGEEWNLDQTAVTPLLESAYRPYTTQSPKATVVSENSNATNAPHSSFGLQTNPEPVTVQATDTISDPLPRATVCKDDETLEGVLAELNSLIGLDKVKNDVQSLINFIKIRNLRLERGMQVPTISYHLVFTGNPGTGKTTVARLVAKLYQLMGILPQGQLIETDRSGLVAGYLGQTAIKTQKVIQQALGGVLFIDEAYSLANDDQDIYGKEAIETILKAMEDHRDELVVIVAGYDELMHHFIDSNPGLRSRFNKYFHFPDYDGKELLLIFRRFCRTNGYTLTADAASYLEEKFHVMYETRQEHFGNARTMRNIFERAIHFQANRLVLDNHITDEELAELTLADILPSLEA